MAKKPTLADTKKKIARLKKELESVQKRQADLADKETALVQQIKNAEADYVIQLLKETDTPVSLLEDLLVSDDKEGGEG
ncbi:UNVERIFIED_CONTAM: hypothetical protein KB574_00010 [Streptococcus canis]